MPLARVAVSSGPLSCSTWPQTINFNEQRTPSRLDKKGKQNDSRQVRRRHWITKPASCGCPSGFRRTGGDPYRTSPARHGKTTSRDIEERKRRAGHKAANPLLSRRTQAARQNLLAGQDWNVAQAKLRSRPRAMLLASHNCTRNRSQGRAARLLRRELNLLPQQAGQASPFGKTVDQHVVVIGRRSDPQPRRSRSAKTR